MNLQFLRYFHVLAEELHFGRAAQRLFITQPPLSAAIKSLEEELGVQLFVRNSKKVELTPVGATFLMETRQILERLNRATCLVKSIDQGSIGRLDIGLSPSLIYRGAIDIVTAFRREHPDIEVVLHEMALSEQAQRLSHGRLDVGFANSTTTPRHLKSMMLPDDVFQLCLCADHPLATRVVVDLKDMAGEEFILFARDIGPVNYDNVTSIFARSGMHPKIIHEVRTWFSTMALVSQGCGVALMPSSLARAGFDGVRFVPIAGQQTSAPAMMLWSPDSPALTLNSFLASASHTIEGWGLNSALPHRN